MTDPRSNNQLAMLGRIRVRCSPRLLDQGSVLVVGKMKHCLYYFTTRSCPHFI